MKIALFTDTYIPQTNGVVVYISDSIKALSKENQIVLFAPSTSKGPLRTEEPSNNFKIYWIPSIPFPFYEGYRMASINYKHISDILKKETPDVIHAHAPINLGLQAILAGKRKRIPVVITYHTHFPDYVPHLLNGKLPGVLCRLSDYTVKKLIKHVFRMANVVTAPTQELTNELKSYGLHNVINIPNGIDFKKLKCRKSEINEFKKQHMIPSDKKIILYLGRVSFEKRLKQLVEAFKKIESNDTCLVIAGSGPHIEEIKKLCEKMRVKNIRFTGFVKNPALAYSCADVFVSASDSETFGLTFVEAMYFGLPVIGVRKFGPKELIKEGKVGFLVEPNDPNELARAIERIVSNDRIRREMGLEAKKTAKKYSIENSVKKMLEIYKKLAVNYPRLKPWACRLDDTHPQQ